MPRPRDLWKLRGSFGRDPIVLVTQLPLLTIGFLFIPLILVGIPICTEAEKSIGRSDPGEVIWDEFASIPLVYVGLPASISLVNPREMLFWLIVGFIYFRIFDIIKPLGIKRIQYIGKGLGVMIDDVLAAVYAAGLLHLTFTFSLSFF